MSSTIQLNTGISIPQIGFGTSKSADPVASVRAAIEAGYRHIDTAQMYGNEAEIGEGVRASGVAREELFITTKLNNGNHAPADAFSTFEESLEKLGLGHVDLFLIHWPMPHLEVDYVETWKAMLELAESGRTKAVGVSNFQPEHLDRIIEATGVAPAVNQIEVHPYFANNEVRKYSKAQGIAVEAWSPLGKGNEFEDPVLHEISGRLGRSVPQVILRWHLQRGDVLIPKSDNPERMAQNFDILGFELSAPDMASIDALDKGEEARRSPHPNEFGEE
ncbi:aldo/keto reductase [Nesterenkonia cremea]|uniref:Oxidoreductase n=1 Tax=Nesterenkonia cremea TaxID=1882340 RepID=A0A917ASK3_9MICC|nr:aldo/keto reductase [Nesterenkonia cremea]GGE67093.1 oxidoreductase [Nesterenkonia cremea]